MQAAFVDFLIESLRKGIATMITVHISPSAETVSIEHTTHGNLVLSPEEAYSIYQRLHERRSDLWKLVARRQVRLLATGNAEPQEENNGEGDRPWLDQ
jgi:hypothetical protein